MRNTDHSIVLADENNTTRVLTSNLEADESRQSRRRPRHGDRAAVRRPARSDHRGHQRTDAGTSRRHPLRERLTGHLNPDTPMIVLSERPDHLHRIRVLERGGDDIIAKPFSYPELRARVAAVLRRAERSRHPRQLRVASLTIDLTARHVRLGDDPVALSAKEYELLVALAHDPHRVFTREELLRNVWGYRTPSRTVDSHACRLRQKLSTHPERLIINVWGVGYRRVRPRRLGVQAGQGKCDEPEGPTAVPSGTYANEAR